MFDIDKREFVVVRQAGGEKNGILLRVEEKAELPKKAMRSTRTVLVARPKALDPRYEEIGVAPKHIACVPVEKAGRYLGLIELLNPFDGNAFSEADGNALTYIGEQFAAFLSERGILLDPEAVVAGAQG